MFPRIWAINRQVVKGLVFSLYADGYSILFATTVFKMKSQLQRKERVGVLFKCTAAWYCLFLGLR